MVLVVLFLVVIRAGGFLDGGGEFIKIRQYLSLTSGRIFDVW